MTRSEGFVSDVSFYCEVTVTPLNMTFPSFIFDYFNIFTKKSKKSYLKDYRFK